MDKQPLIFVLTSTGRNVWPSLCPPFWCKGIAHPSSSPTPPICAICADVFNAPWSCVCMGVCVFYFPQAVWDLLISKRGSWIVKNRQLTFHSNICLPNPLIIRILIIQKKMTFFPYIFICCKYSIFILTFKLKCLKTCIENGVVKFPLPISHSLPWEALVFLCCN